MTCLKLWPAVLAAWACVAGCGRHPEKSPIRFRYSGDLSEVRIIKASVEDFLKSNPSVKVKAEYVPYDGYNDRLIVELGAGQAPDVFAIGGTTLDQLIAIGKVHELDGFLSAEKDLKKGDFYRKAIERLSRDGRLYGLPRDVAPIACVYYNKKLFDEAGLPYPRDDWNWEGLREMALRLTKRDGSGRISQFGYGEDYTILESWILSAGGSLVDDLYRPTKITADSPASLAGILFRWKLAQVDKVMPNHADLKTLSGGSMSMFQNGQMAMFHSGIWKTPEFRNIKDFDWDVAMFPKGPTGRRSFILGLGAYAMKKETPDPAGAWKLLKFIGGHEGQRRLAATGLAQPAIKSIAATAFLDDQKPANKKMLLQAADLATPDPQWLDITEFQRSIWYPQTDVIWTNHFKGNVADVVRKAVANGNRKFFPDPRKPE